MTKRNQSPHYIPELDPENNEEAEPDRMMRGLLLEWHTWLVFFSAPHRRLSGSLTATCRIGRGLNWSPSASF